MVSYWSDGDGGEGCWWKKWQSTRNIKAGIPPPNFLPMFRLSRYIALLVTSRILMWAFFVLPLTFMQPELSYYFRIWWKAWPPSEIDATLLSHPFVLNVLAKRFPSKRLRAEFLPKQYKNPKFSLSEKEHAPRLTTICPTLELTVSTTLFSFFLLPFSLVP